MEHKPSTARSNLEQLLVDETAEPNALPLSLLKDITGDFSNDQEIGSGGFAVVYKGILGDRVVAVKKLTDALMDENIFHREVECLMRVKHKNVVRFLGYCADRQGKMETYEGKLVMADLHQRLLCFEYIPKGSLHKYITDPDREWGMCYKIIKGICEGLQNLHDNRIVHLDLKPANILLDDNMEPKITDFGLSRCFNETQSRDITKTILGTIGYMAPELREGGIIARSADIYSLGVIIIEILTGQKGYLATKDVLESWSGRLERSQQETLCKQVRVCYKTALECIAFNPMKRPASARNIIDRLHQMESNQKKNPDKGGGGVEQKKNPDKGGGGVERKKNPDKDGGGGKQKKNPDMGDEGVEQKYPDEDGGGGKQKKNPDMGDEGVEQKEYPDKDGRGGKQKMNPGMGDEGVEQKKYPDKDGGEKKDLDKGTGNGEQKKNSHKGIRGGEQKEDPDKGSEEKNIDKDGGGGKQKKNPDKHVGGSEQKKNSYEGFSLKLTTVRLSIRMDCDGCKNKIKRYLHRFEGVYQSSVDVAKNEVVVAGRVNVADMVVYLKDKLGKNVKVVEPGQKDDKKDKGGSGDGEKMQKDKSAAVRNVHKDKGKIIEVDGPSMAVAPEPVRDPYCSVAYPQPQDPPHSYYGGNAKDKDDGGSEQKKANKEPLKETKPSEETTVLLRMRLHCDRCVEHIVRYIYKIKGVVDVVVEDVAKNEVKVVGTIDVTHMVLYLKEKLGGPVEAVEPGKNDDKKDKGEKKQKDNVAAAGDVHKDRGERIEVDGPPSPVRALYGSVAYPEPQGPPPSYYNYYGGNDDGVRHANEGSYHQNPGGDYQHPNPQPYQPYPQYGFVPPPQMLSVEENPNACSVM